MKRKIVAAAAAFAATASISIVNAPAADAYAYWRNGYFYGDTSYRGNVSGAHVRIIGRRDIPRQLYHLRIFLYDTRTDRYRAAARIRGWDKQTNRWVFWGSLAMDSGHKGRAEGFFTFSTDVADTIIVQDGIYGKTYGSNSVACFRRYR